MAATADAVLLLALAFVPPVAYAIWVRNLERREREPWSQVAKAFVWGATGGVVLAILLSLALAFVLAPGYAGLAGALRVTVPFAALTGVLVAPLAEEPAKAFGLRFVRDPFPEPEDGLVYGAAAGLGFAATENLLYAYDALQTGGVQHLLAVAAVRSVASAFLHASASAIVGYAWMSHRSLASKGAFLVLAIFLHGTYNGLLSSGAVLSYYIADPLAFAFVGFVIALVLAVGTFRVIRRNVRRLDCQS